MRYQNIATRKGALSRRLFLLGASTTAITVACSPQNLNPENNSISNLRYLKSGFADGLISPTTLSIGSPQRAPFLLYGSDGIPIVNNVPKTIAASLQLPSGKSIELDLERFSEAIPTPYFLLRFETYETGIHKLSYVIDENPQSLSFFVDEQENINLVQIGDKLRETETPTFDDPLNFSTICTRFDPCPYHTVTVREALSNSLPTVLLISTPGFCQTSICGPSLEILIDLLEDNSESLNVIHAEVYVNPEEIAKTSNITELLSPAVKDYGMTFEPSLITTNSENIVTARLDYTFDKSEMKTALSTIS